MHIDRKPSTVMTVINRIYQPIAQDFGISLSLRNEINSELQFPPRFFVNVIQITGNLVANAIKFTSSAGLVDVVFKMKENEGYRTLYVNVSDNGNIISPELVLAINRTNRDVKMMSKRLEEYLGSRLEYVLHLVAEEGGRLLVKSENSSGTTFSMSLPLKNNYMIQRNGYHSIIENGAVLLNESLN
ncbi:MAG: ATP-binding protein [Balneolaceae bacterium]